MTLYELAAQWEEFAQLAAEEDLPPEVIADTLEGLEGEFDEKADSIACIIKELETQAAGIEVQENILNARKLAKRANAKRLEEFLSEQMQRIGRERVETDRNMISFRRSTALRIDDEEDFKQRHMELCKVETTVKIPRKEITDRLKAGEEISGATLETRKNLQIK